MLDAEIQNIIKLDSNRIINRGGKLAVMLSPSSVEKVSKVAKYILKQKNKIKFNKNEMKLGGLTDGFIQFFGKKNTKVFNKRAKNGGILQQLQNFNPDNYSRPLSRVNFEPNKFKFELNSQLKTERLTHSNLIQKDDLENNPFKNSIFITNLKSQLQSRTKSLSVMTKFKNKKGSDSSNNKLFMSPRIVRITKYLDKLMAAKKDEDM